MYLQAPSGERSRIFTDTMGQLETYQTSTNMTVRFSYHGNTGLVESRDDMDSLLTYEYDNIGHLSAVMTTSGHRITLRDDAITAPSGEQVLTLSTGDSTHKMAVGDSQLSVTTGEYAPEREREREREGVGAG